MTSYIIERWHVYYLRGPNANVLWNVYITRHWSFDNTKTHKQQNVLMEMGYILT
jgi:hypothetical protein